MKGEKGWMTSLPQTSPPQRVLFVVDILAKEQMLLRALKGEQEEAVGSDPLLFPPFSFTMAPGPSLVPGYLWDPKPNRIIRGRRKQSISVSTLGIREAYFIVGCRC